MALTPYFAKPSLFGLQTRWFCLRVCLCVCASFAVARDASAYCRTTTCNVGNETCSVDQNGCTTTGHPISWSERCLSFDLQRDATPAIPLDLATRVISTAFVTWRDAACADGTHPSLEFYDLGPVGCDQVQFNKDDPDTGTVNQGNANVIMFRNPWPYPDAGDKTLALTTVTFNADTGEIYDADMEINAAKKLTTVSPPPSDGFDLQSIVTHEVGHFLGLAHSKVDGATMSTNYMPGTDSFRSLGADDIAGICSMYPAARMTPECYPEPRHGFLSDCGIQTTRGCSIGRVVPTGSRGSALAMGSVIALALAGGARRAKTEPRKRRARSLPAPASDHRP